MSSSKKINKNYNAHSQKKKHIIAWESMRWGARKRGGVASEA